MTTWNQSKDEVGHDVWRAQGNNGMLASIYSQNGKFTLFCGHHHTSGKGGSIPNLGDFDTLELAQSKAQESLEAS